MGELTEDEMKQLLEQAQTNAKPDDSYAPLADRVTAIEEWETAIEERLSKLESGSSTDPGNAKFSELQSNLHLVELSETRGLLIFQGGTVQTNSNGIGNISLISPSHTITPRNTPSWYGPVIVNQNTVEKARFTTSRGNIQITAKASSSIQIAPFTLMVNLS